jgi:hypothetical protein
MNAPWHYLVNQFVSVTRKNFTKAFKLSNYHDAYLNRMKNEDPADPDWALLYNRYHPVHLDFVTIDTAWKNAGGQQQGQTLNVDQLLELLNAKVNKWDALIQSETGFEKGTANYVSIFPQGRYPFNNGGKTERVEAVNVLAMNIAAYPPLNAVKLLVADYFQLLEAAHDGQEGAKGSTKSKGQEVDIQRMETMAQQYRNLGFLMDKYFRTPQFVQPFFDLNVLRESRQTEFTGTLHPKENEAILIHTFVADDELQLQITAEASSSNSPHLPVEFYLATMANGTDSVAAIVIPNAAAITISAADFGIVNYGTHRYLTVVNPNSEVMRYVVQLL